MGHEGVGHEHELLLLVRVIALLAALQHKLRDTGEARNLLNRKAAVLDELCLALADAE